MAPIYSFIIPAHNESKHIRDTIKSIIDSVGDRKYEIIVVCDYCKDDTHKIAEEMGAKAIDVYNKNIAKTRNAGAKIAEGYLLVFIDADTYMTPRAIDKATKKLRRKDIAVVGSYWNGDVSNMQKWIFQGMTNCYLKLTETAPGNFLVCRKKQFIPFPVDATIEDVVWCEKMKSWGKIKLLKGVIETSMRRVDEKGLFSTIYHYTSREVLWIAVTALIFHIFIIIGLILLFLYIKK